MQCLFNVPEESKYCLCDICLENYEIKEKGREFLKQSSSVFNLDPHKMRKFFQLISALDQKIYFRLAIPELCFFEGGEGKVLYKSKANGIAQVSITPEFRKQIPNFFLDSRKPPANAHPTFADSKHNHIKYFDSIIPSFKHGLSNDNLDNRPKNYTFHCNHKNEEEGELLRVHQNAAAEVAIVKYRDQALELVNEKQLRGIMKSAVKTQHIEVIQGYIKPHEKESEFIFSEYVEYRKPDNVLMFNRSLIQMKTEIGLLSKFSKEYIPLEYLEEYEQMLKEMPEEYCLYETYKMIHYIEINRDVRVQHLTTVWFKDELRELAFFGVAHFDYQENEKLTADVANIVELKDIMKTDLTHLEQELLNVWEGMKKRKMRTASHHLTQQEQSFLKEIELIKQESKSRTLSEVLLHHKHTHPN